jgi:hypothetical protein
LVCIESIWTGLDGGFRKECSFCCPCLIHHRTRLDTTVLCDSLLIYILPCVLIRLNCINRPFLLTLFFVLLFLLPLSSFVPSPI